MTKQNGFSLIEILVVLVIMGLLISVVAPTVLNSADDARIQKVQADFKSIETALKIYRLDNYVYPTTEQGLEALVTPSSLNPSRAISSRVAISPSCRWTRGVVRTCTCRRVSIGRQTSIRWAPTACQVGKARTPILVTGIRQATESTTLGQGRFDEAHFSPTRL